MKLKKILASILCIAMVLGTMGTVVFAESIAVTVATAEELQAALDNYTTGTTIQLTEGVDYGVVYLRPSPENPATLDSDVHFDWTGNNYGYESLTIFEDMTINGAEGATIDAIKIEGGQYFNTPHSQSETYPVMFSLIELKNVTLDGITFTGEGGYDPQGHGNVLNFAGNNIKVSGITVQNCVLNDETDNARLMYKTESTTASWNYTCDEGDGTFVSSLADITVSNCTFNGGYMGLELREANNVTITDNTFNNVISRDILLPSNSGCTYSGEITITGNTSNGAGDRFLRADGIGNAALTVSDNEIINYAGGDEDFIKVSGATGECSIVNNTFDGSATFVTSNNGTYTVVEDQSPEVIGDVINVNAKNAQDVLDGKYGDITGKTINFTCDINEVLELARPTKYQGSNTTYYKYDSSIPGPEATATEWSEDISSVMNSHSHYYRTLSDVTFTADDGVSIAGFTFSAGHVASSGYDYVRDVELTSGVAYYKHSSMDNITFDKLTFTGRFDAKLYLEGCSVEDIVFDGCTFTGATTDGSNAAVKFLADSQYFTNVTVKNCTIDGYYQGIYISGIDGASITNNNISNIEHNAMALQSYNEYNSAKGAVVVKENYITNGSDRAIRFNYIGDAEITINNNIIVNCGDSDGELIKATAVAEEAVVDLEANYWDGKELATAVVNFEAPATVGITGGTWSNIDAETLAGYLFEDAYVAEDGTVILPVIATIDEVEYSSLKAALNAAEEGAEIVLVADAEVTDEFVSLFMDKELTLVMGDYTLTTESSLESRDFIVVPSGYSISRDRAGEGYVYSLKKIEVTIGSSVDSASGGITSPSTGVTPPATEDGTPEDGTPEDGTPEDGTPEDGTPEDGTPEDGTPEEGTTEEGTVGTLGTFTDVTTDSWAYDGIAYCVENGIMNGVSETSFDANATLNRAMLVTMLYRLSGSPEVEADGSDWYSAARTWAMNNGISDGSNMNGSITREQLATMLYRYASSKGEIAESTAALDSFTDNADVSEYAAAAIKWAVEKGLINGMGDGTLAPQGSATRAQVATIFMRGASLF